MMKHWKLDGKHHPYCEHDYNVYKNTERPTGWTCSCTFLKSYDTWRAKNVWTQGVKIVGKEGEKVKLSKTWVKTT